MRIRVNLFDKCRKWIHPLLLTAMPGRRNFPIEIISPMPVVSGNKLFVMNHSSAHDAPIACEVIKEHFHILVAKQSLAILDRIFFWLNGVVYIDRKNKQSKKRGFNKMLKILERGNNLLMYPEGTWNITPSKPMLPLNWGVIDLAKFSGVPIVPIIAEYHPDCCYVKFGEAIYINGEMDKKNGIELLEEVMATLKWDIWERFPTRKRSNEMKEEFEQMIQQRIAAYPKCNLEYELSVVRGREDTPEYVLGR